MLAMYKGLLIIAMVMVAVVSQSAGTVDFVDTRVGTAFATTQTAGLFGKGSEEHGQTIPAVTVPNGMNFWTPQTRDTEQKCIAPYYYADSLFQGFRNSHWLNGGCTQDYGSMTVAFMGDSLRTSPKSRGLRFSHEDEIARPDYYSLQLPDEGLGVEMTGTSRAAIFRVTYSDSGTGCIVVNPNSDEGEGWIEVDMARRQIRGENPVHRIYQGWGERAGFSGYFVVALPDDMDIIETGCFCGDTVYAGQSDIRGTRGIGAYVRFRTAANKPMVVKAALSFTYVNGAIGNLNAEIPGWNFLSVRQNAASEWNRRFGLARVEGGSDSDKAMFYGSLYRASLLPRTLSDADGSYPAFASNGVVNKMPDGQVYYDDFSMWDTYRALHPLITLLTPERSGEMMQSLVLKACQGGWMPIFPCWNSYTAAMIGDHCAVAIADAAMKGVRNFDLDTAYKYLRQNAFVLPGTYGEYADGMGRRALDSYLKCGYIPLEDTVGEAFHRREQTSRTLEYALDDFALSQLASLLGIDGDADTLRRRSENWRNVYDPVLGYVNGRFIDGTFAKNTDPFGFNKAITEGAPCHYTWYVPHNPRGLIEAMGGSDSFVSKLDSMFTCRRYWHGNEPCHQVAYMFNYAGRYDLTQKWVRYIAATEYQNTPGGLSGNDDAGQMSAWYVFTALGFYPVCPSQPEYALGAPLFEKVVLKPEGGKPLVIMAHDYSAENMYVAEVRLNGVRVDGGIITHGQLTGGGLLEFFMANCPR